MNAWEFVKGVSFTVLGASVAVVMAMVIALPFVLMVGNLALALGMAEDPAEGFAVLAFLAFVVCLIAGCVLLALLLAGCRRALTTGAIVVPTSAAALVTYSVIIERGGVDPGGPLAAIGYALLVLFVGAVVARLIAVVPVPPLGALSS